MVAGNASVSGSLANPSVGVVDGNAVRANAAAEIARASGSVATAGASVAAAGARVAAAV